MMRFSLPVGQFPGPDAFKATWRALLTDPMKLYDLQLLLAWDDHRFYYATDHIYLLKELGDRTHFNVLTRTTATAAVQASSAVLIVKDFLGHLPEKYDIIPGGRVDGEDLRVKLDQWLWLHTFQLESRVAMYEGDVLKLNLGLTLPTSELR